MSGTYDAIVIGGGAAGLYYALTAGQRGKSVLVIEHNDHVGAKILISGGGRCNFTNVETRADRFVSANPDFARSALARHTPEDFLKLIERHRIAYYEKTLGQLFCEGAGSARKIVDMLLAECAAGGVEIRNSCRVSDVRRAERFTVETDQGTFEAKALVLASGGLSIPKLGASDFAYRIARQFDLPVVTPRAGLVPLTFRPEDVAWMKPLAGVSLPVIARTERAAFEEGALFTHRGLSGPAILQASSYWKQGEALMLDLLPNAPPDLLAARKRERPHAQLKTVLADILPARLAETLAEKLPQAEIGDLKDQKLADIVAQLKAFLLNPAGTEGYAKAEVTVGGVDTSALSQRTLEAKAVPGFFVIGEAVDVTGWLGGYNFQWAWSSGAAAGQAL